VLTAVQFAAGKAGAKGQLEKRMQGDAAGVDGRDPGGRGDHQPFVGLFFDCMEEGGLAGARLAGEKDGAVGVLDKGFRQFEFGVGNTHGQLMGQ